MHNKNIFLLTLVLFIVSFFNVIYGGEIKGKIIDSTTNEPIIGATIFLTNKAFGYSGFDGSYSIKNVPEGTYKVVCSNMGFADQEKTIFVPTSIVALNFILKEKQTSLKEVVIAAKQNKEGEKYALNREKNSQNILNAISAKTIQLLPDITTAAVLQRMSGVSLERTSNGEARFAIIRGMDKRYNYTLVNGIKIPSPDDKFRYVPMDMFPADLLERLEVIKALTPAMEGDAIGGAMDLIMKNAPNKLTITANLATGFSQFISDNGYENFDKNVINSKSPAAINGPSYIATPNDFTYKNFDYNKKSLPLNTNLGFSIGNRFLKDKKLGVVVATSYQNELKGTNSTWFKPENQPAPGNVPAFTDLYSRRYNTNQTRFGVHTKLDYILNAKNKISLYNVYLKSEETQNRKSIDTSLSIGRSGVGTGNTYKLYRSRYIKQSIYNSTLQGEHQLNNHLSTDWSAVYSLAKSATPDWSEYQTVERVGYDIDHNQTVTPVVLNIPFKRIWMDNSDRDYAGYLNLKYKRELFNKPMVISVGGLYRSKSRNNNYDEYNLIPNSSSSGEAIPYDGVLSPDKFHFNGDSAAQGSPNNALNYDATEKIAAYYFQDDIQINDKFSILGGLRIENTAQTWKTAQDATIIAGAIGSITYTDYLPSIHFKYKLSEKENLRFSYFSAINRPGFYEYIPFKIDGEDFNLSGNPNLKHAVASNFDFRYELFPKGLDQFLIGGFYKNIQNPIESAILFSGTSSATLKPINFGTATNYGVEVNMAKYFGKFGVSANYTYTYSKITTSKLFYNSSYVSEETTQTRPLQGQSPHIANVSLLYKNQKSGLDVQLAYVYTGKKITLVSPYKDLDYWQKGISQLDFSIEKKAFKYFTFYSKITNLLNTPVIVQILQPNIYTTGNFALPNQTDPNRVTVQKDLYGQNFTFGMRYKF
ncbi:TonB-dependent receptor [Flavobacterium cellulosilyticum]|uniref:TonB-dependent receptor n=1 Tax=Flavobacterium cellulosilyticum TaxID=2541731 RepID=A0A4R5CKM1_9FLAO|nr:TonB-dependent receptor [Flavobacterium cellulosilyticum]TDD99746.1 TonB-dependent receptor [Flavobacterium cellulosilyticum]